MKTIITIIMMIVTYLSFTQNTYLKISEDNKTSVNYPPGSKFELKNKHGYIILKERSTPLVFKIDEPYTLNVFPTYKSRKDVYKLTDGKIELVSNEEDMNHVKNEKTASNGVTGEKIITNSKTIKKVIKT